MGSGGVWGGGGARLGAACTCLHNKTSQRLCLRAKPHSTALDLVRAHFHAWRHGAITNAFFLGEDELAICLSYRVRDAKVMRHYICKKLGLLMPGNTSANLAGCATAQAPTLGTMIAELRDSLIVPSAMSKRLPEPPDAQRASAAVACAASESHWVRRA